MYNTADCNLFAHDNTNNTLNFFEGIVADNNSGLSFDVTKEKCYLSTTAETAFSKLLEVTGIVEDQRPTSVPGVAVDIYRLFLDEEVSE